MAEDRDATKNEFGVPDASSLKRHWGDVPDVTQGVNFASRSHAKPPIEIGDATIQ
jgi:hypothetical protein